MKVGSRLALGFSTLIVIGIVVAVFGRIQLERLADEVQLLVFNRMVKVEQITEATVNINLIARAVRNIALASDHQEMEEEKETHCRCPRPNCRHLCTAGKIHPHSGRSRPASKSHCRKRPLLHRNRQGRQLRLGQSSR